MKNQIIASAGSKECLEKLINEYYMSENYLVTDDNKVYNKKLNKVLEGVQVIYQRKRWRFEHIN